MGGIIIFTAISIPFLILSDYDWRSVGVFGAAIACALLGFADDYTKIVKRRSLGLRARTKLGVTIAISIGLWWIATAARRTSPTRCACARRRPRSTSASSTRCCIYLVVAGTTSAVNLTDGLDGLAAGCAAIVLLAYIGITFITTGQTDLALLAGCLVGACVGFLWFNAFPATIFMGDTGSLGLGGAIAGLAVMTKTEVLLILLGGIFVVEALSRADPGLPLPDLPQARVPDGADPPPLRDARRGRRRRSSCASGSSRAICAAIGFTHLPAVRHVTPRPPLPGGPYLVVGLARSGRRGAAGAAGPRASGVDGRRRRQARALDVHLAPTARARSTARGRQVAGRPARGAGGRRGARARASRSSASSSSPGGCSPTSSSRSPGTNGKTTTTELHRPHPPRGRAAGGGRRQRRDGAELARRRARAGRGRRLRGVVVPARGHRRVRARGRGAAQPRSPTTSTATGRSRPTARRSCGSSRARATTTSRSLPDGLGVEDLGGCARRVRFGGAAAGDRGSPSGGRCGGHDEPLIAVDELRLRGAAQPRERDGRGGGRLARGVDVDAVRDGAADVRAASRTASRRSRRVDGVLYVNDSKATNVDSTLVALRALRRPPVHLILGGRGKGQDFAPLAARSRERCASVHLIGEDAGAIAAADRRRRRRRRPRARRRARPRRSPARATSSCSRRRARASTSSPTSRRAGDALPQDRRLSRRRESR